ncbi:MAG: DUF1365 domain-containing protein [Aquisalinus sp.]|nr:DUF1365 domain-containing protein [Aquisalinus sp.]
MNLSEEAENFDTRLYVGAVSHRRLRPVSHRFSYRIFSSLINIDELPALDSKLKWFKYNRFGLLGFRDRDHGAKDGSPLRPWIERKLRDGGYDFKPGTIRLLCFPRLLGLVFNPLSIWYCHDTEGRLRVILYEVRNTFGEWRGYMLPVENQDQPEAANIRQACDKSFYVSPLMEMNCRYHFSLNEPAEKLRVGIRETQENQRTLLAVQTGRRVPFTDKNLLGTFLSHPLMYFKIVAAIHWEALRVLLKGVKFQVNPRGQTGDVTYPEKPGK